MEQDEILRRSEALFASEGWPVIVKLLKDADEVAVATIRARPSESLVASHILAGNESLRNALRTISRLVAAVNQGVDINDPDSTQELPEVKDIFDA